MRYAREHKEGTRRRIVAAAGRLFRGQGASGASVGRVMSAAGLTVGGFYAHFESKRALFVETLRTLMRARRAAAALLLARVSGDAALTAFVRAYVTAANRDRVETGCPVIPLLSDMARQDRATRRAFAGELDGLVATISGAAAGRGARARALRTVALCFGAVSIARATAGTRLSDEILAACASGTNGRA